MTVWQSTASQRVARAAADVISAIFVLVPPTVAPIFLAAASDHQLGFAPFSTEAYNAWLAQRRSAELHLHEKGGHGFGVLKRGLPVDSWTERFADWLRFHGFLQTPR